MGLSQFILQDRKIKGGKSVDSSLAMRERLEDTINSLSGLIDKEEDYAIAEVDSAKNEYNLVGFYNKKELIEPHKVSIERLEQVMPKELYVDDDLEYLHNNWRSYSRNFREI